MDMRWKLICVCALLLAARPSVGQVLHTVDLIQPESSLVAFDSEGVWNFESQGRQLTVDNLAIVRWGAWPGIRTYQAVWLSDGSWLCGEVRVEGGAVVVVDNDWLQTTTLAIDSIRGLVLTPPITLSGWLELHAQMLAAEGDRDQVWLAGQKKHSGVIRWPAVGTAESLAVDAGGQSVSLALDDVRAIVFSPTLIGKLPERQLGFQVGMVDGSLLQTRNIAQESDNKVTLRLQGGLTLVSHDSARDFASAVVLVAGAPPRARALGGLQIASYRHLSDSTLSWPLGVNRRVNQQPLNTTAGVLFEGLAMHSASQVAYRWDGSPGRLLSEVKLAQPQPTADARLGSVQCQVLVARSGSLEKVEQFTLRRQAGDEEQRHLVDVDISQARLVVLVVEQADFGQYGDEVLWLNARIALPP